MAGAITRTTTISATQPLSSLGIKLSQLIDDSTIGGISDDESGSQCAIMRYQGTAPSSVANDFWHDSTRIMLRYYSGASGQERWDPIGHGVSLKNGTAGTRISGDVVSGNPAAMTYDNDSTGYIVGVVGESAAAGSFGLVRMTGKATVAATAAMTRGDFVKGSASAGNLAVSNGTTLDGSFGIALESAASSASYALPVYLFPYNKT